MPTCDFFSSKNHYQSHVCSFRKVLNFFRNFHDSVDFISIILQGWGKLGLLGFCSESRFTRISNGSQVKTKIEITLQAKQMDVFTENSIWYTLPSIFSCFQCETQEFASFHYFFEGNFFTFPSSRVGQPFAICAGVRTIHFQFPLGKFSSLWLTQVSMKTF